MAHVTEEQFVERDPYSRGSLHNQLLHMASAQPFKRDKWGVQPDKAAPPESSG